MRSLWLALLLGGCASTADVRALAARMEKLENLAPTTCVRFEEYQRAQHGGKVLSPCAPGGDGHAHVTPISATGTAAGK